MQYDYTLAESVIDVPFREGSGESIAIIMADLDLDVHWSYAPELSDEAADVAVYVHVMPDNARVYLTVTPQN